MPFYYASREENCDSLLIEGEEAHHLIRVLRVQVGQNLKIASPDGKLLEVTVTSVSKKDILVEKLRELPTPPPPFPIHLFLALIKPEKIEWVLEKATELNIASVTLIQTKHSTREKLSENKWNRFKKILNESQKQCERIIPLKLSEPQPFDAIDSSPFVNLFCLERIQSSSVREIVKSKLEATAIWIGPEGGWNEVEVNTAKENNFKFVSLGPLVLRAETAALHAISSVLACGT